MEHLQGWWYIDTRWHHYRHCQMPNLTLPCWRAHRDDQNGHLDHPIWSPDGKVMSPGKSPTRPCLAGRHDIGRSAWHLPITLATHHHSLGDSPMDPQTLGNQARSESKTERPHMSLQWALEVATLSWAGHPRIGAAPTCKVTQGQSIPTIGLNSTQVEGVGIS